MIQLPVELEITRDEIREVSVYESMRQRLAKDDATRQAGIHASDLLDLRQAYFRWLDPKPLSERQVYFFIIGKTLHNIVLDETPGASDAGTLEELGILFSPDKREEGFPIELKSSRAQYEPKPGKMLTEFHQYFEQLTTYMVLMNCLRGELWVLFLNLKDASNRTFPELRCYQVVMTEEQFHVVEKEVVAARDALIQAKEQRNHTSLVLCRAWKCGPEACAWWGACRPPGRYPNVTRKQWTT